MGAVVSVYSDEYEADLFHVTFLFAGLRIQHGPWFWSTAVMRSNDLRLVAGVSEIDIVASTDLEVF